MFKLREENPLTNSQHHVTHRSLSLKTKIIKFYCRTENNKVLIWKDVKLKDNLKVKLIFERLFLSPISKALCKKSYVDTAGYCKTRCLYPLTFFIFYYAKPFSYNTSVIHIHVGIKENIMETIHIDTRDVHIYCNMNSSHLSHITTQFRYTSVLHACCTL